MSNSTASITSFTSSDDTVVSSTTPVDTPSDTTTAAVVISTTFASSVPPTTEFITSTQIVSSTAADGSVNTEPAVVIVTSTRPGTTVHATTQRTRQQTADTSSTSAPAALSGNDNNGSGSSGGGLSTAGTTAIAVVIPVVVVALLVGLGIWFWRKRKSKKSAAEQRQKEMEDYSYNPNGDPTLPAIGSDAGTGTQMAEDHSSGYRGWGAAAAMSNRKQSTTLSAGNTHEMTGGSGGGSDYGNSYGHQPSPHGNMSDAHSGDPILHNQRSTMGSDDIAELGSGPAAGAAGGIRRGPSNASSAYSAGARSDEEAPPMPPPGQAYDYNPNGYSQHGPYGDGSYGGGGQADMPVVRDVSARRNTRINPGGSYQQGNSGIAQNF